MRKRPGEGHKPIPATLLYILGGVALNIVLFFFWGAFFVRFFLIVAVVPLALWLQARGWKRDREARIDRQKRWGLKRPIRARPESS